MKKYLFLSAIVFLISSAAVNAQMQHQTVQERVTATMAKLTDLKLDAATTTKADSIFTNFYTAQQQAMQDMRASGQMDRDAMKQKRQQLEADRDAKLKAIFTDDQYNKWKNDIEPTLRPQRANKQAAQ
jgi:protein CpxP